MHEAIAGLDDGGVTELGPGLIFKHEGGLPRPAILTDREIQWAAALGGVVVNDQVAPVPQGHGIGAGIGVRELRQCHRSPGLAGVRRSDLENFPLFGPPHGEELVAPRKKQTGLDGADLFAIIDGSRRQPRLPTVAAPLEMHPPPVVFRTGRTQDVAIGQLHRLVFDGAKNPFRQPAGVAPGFPGVVRLAQHPPPGVRGGADFVK